MLITKNRNSVNHPQLLLGFITKVHVLPHDLLICAALLSILLPQFQFRIEDAQRVHVCHQVTTRLRAPRVHRFFIIHVYTVIVCGCD